MQNAGTLFKLEKVACRLQGYFSNLKSTLAKCRGIFHCQKVPLQIAREDFESKETAISTKHSTNASQDSTAPYPH